SDTCTYLRQSYRPFLFSDPSTSQIYTLSLHDALPISVVPYPSTIYLAVNTRCGFACKMCDVGMDQYDTQFYKIMSLSKDKPRERLALDRLKTLVDEVKDFKPMIAATSTEPLLYKDLIPLC